jgi:PLP dependent protein
MHDSVKNLTIIRNKISKLVYEKQLKTNPEIIAVTKTFSLDKILPLIEAGHLHFGENKVNEALEKWSDTRNKYKNIKLHMIGALQSNKAKKAVEIFDYLHSLDSDKLASKISKHENELGKKTKIFIQINIGDESQKSGINLKEIHNFYNYCSKDLLLNVIGLMCLPPLGSSSTEYFKLLNDASKKINLKELSMGMSGDFENAVIHEATYLRLGTAILGKRN